MESGVVTFHISDDFSVSGAPNGGYLAHLAVRAARGVVQQPDLLSLSTRYLRKAWENEDADFAVSPIAVGRSISTVSVTLTQGGQPTSTYLMTFGNLGSQSGPSFLGTALWPPDLPLPEDDGLIDVLQHGQPLNRSPGSAKATLHKHLSLLVRSDCSFARSAMSGRVSPSNELSYEGWCGFVDGRTLDLQACIWLVDALPPPVLTLMEIAWVPTLELTVRCFAKPAPGSHRLKLRYSCTACVNGLLESETTVWDASGQLVARAGQLALLKLPAASRL